MTIQQMGQVMDILTVAYPAYYKKSTDEERIMACQLWAQMFADDEPKIVVAAVKAFIAADDKGFPPAIGQIKTHIAKIVGGNQKSELEAWAEVKKALSNSGYHSTEEFEKLDLVIKRIVGGPSQLREWAQADINTLDTVIASNFQRSYRACEKSYREHLTLPSAVRDLISSVADSMEPPKEPEQKSLPVSVEAIVQEFKQTVSAGEYIPTRTTEIRLSPEEFEKRRKEILRELT